MIRTLLAGLIFGMAALATAQVYRFASSAVPLQHGQASVVVMPGSGLGMITRQLQHAGALPEGHLDALEFRLLAFASGDANRLKAGLYVLQTPVTPLQLLHKLANGEVTPLQVRFIEGWTFAQIRAALDANPWIRHDSAGMSDAEVMRALDMHQASPEGWFFPSTYDVTVGGSDLSVLRRAYALMQQHLQQAWAGRASGLPYASPVQALTMASIIEKETGQASERPLVASVFINRLHLGMRLQTDPTVIYGMGSAFDGNLRKNDLQTDTPYNTYTRAGLPPTPIAMPGMASIEAALHPLASNDLYFVARGDGTHVFSARLADHNRAVARYQKLR
ncbi:MAG: endolytic transglycosylase MltG [Betaproteobacteria bacterium]|nr:endolytic transglycosylase MltG [Betaproteobacteria bacterium]